MEARERLADATQDLLWERGYAAMSPKDIQRRAQVGQGSMYHHFSGKQELAIAALERSAATLRSEAELLLTAPGTAGERLEAYLRRSRDSLRGCRMGRMTYDADVIADPALLDPVSTALGWLVDTIAGVVAQGVDAGEFAADTDPTAVAAAVVAVVQGGYVLARAAQDRAAYDAAVEGAVTLLRGWAQVRSAQGNGTN